MCGGLLQLQSWLQAKYKKWGTYAKRTQVEARVFTLKEGCSKLQQLCEEACIKEQYQHDDAVWKATENNACHKWRADGSHIFIGPLNKIRWKKNFKNIAAALALPNGGKKDKLLDKIFKHFEKHSNLKTNPQFEGFSTHSPQICSSNQHSWAHGWFVYCPQALHSFSRPFHNPHFFKLLPSHFWTGASGHVS